jgi:hypothetical protein
MQLVARVCVTKRRGVRKEGEMPEGDGRASLEHRPSRPTSLPGYSFSITPVNRRAPLGLAKPDGLPSRPDRDLLII